MLEYSIGPSPEHENLTRLFVFSEVTRYQDRVVWFLFWSFLVEAVFIIEV